MNIDNLIQYNSWWLNGKVDPNLLEIHRRPLYNELVNYLDNRQVLVVYGLRRTGKTTTMYQIIHHLLENGTQRNNIMYFSFDQEVADIKEIMTIYQETILKRPITNEKSRIFLFLDEIQKLKYWYNQVKILYDLHPNLKIIISGSASIGIQRHSKESLAGRMFSFLMKPMEFGEYLELNQISFDHSNIRIYKDSIAPHFNDYLLKGGFPEIVKEKDTMKVRRYLSELVERVVMIDIQEEFNIKNYGLLKTMVNMVEENPGMILNYESLSRSLSVSKETLINYFSYLEYSLIIGFVSNLRNSLNAVSRKMKKVYFNSPSFCLTKRVIPDDTFFGKVIENFVFSKTNANFYFRNGGNEIDFILKENHILPIEVKYKNSIDLKKFVNSLKKLKIDRGLIISKDSFDDHEVDGIRIKVIPAWFLALKKNEELLTLFE